MKTTTVMLAAVLALSGGLGAVAQVHGGHALHAEHGPEGAEGAMAVPHILSWLVDTALNDLGTSEAQRVRMQAVKDRVMSQAQALHAAHDATHEEFKRQWDTAKIDSARLHALVDERVEEMRRVLHTAVDGLVEVHDTLTPEQRRALTARTEAMHGAK